MQYITVRNFEKFQHYRDGSRQPIWIKLYNKLLDNYDFNLLPDSAKYHLIGIWLLASRNNNRVPADSKWLANHLNATDDVDIKLLAKSGFIDIVDDSGKLAECLQDATLEKSREEKSREEKIRRDKPLSASADACAQFETFWAAWPSHFRKKGKKSCLDFWRRHGLSEVADKVMAALRVCKASDQWKQDGGQFIPMPRTWMGQTPWESSLADLAAEPRGEGDYDCGLSKAELFAQERQFLPPEPTGPPEKPEGDGGAKDDNDDLLWEH